MTDKRSTEGCFPASLIVLEVLGQQIVRVETHNRVDDQSPDILWLAGFPTDEFTEGRALFVSPDLPSELWRIEECDVNKFVASIPNWSFTCSLPEIRIRLQTSHG